MFKLIPVTIVACSLFFASCSSSDGTDNANNQTPDPAALTLLQRLGEIEGVTASSIAATDHFSQAFELRISQPLRHGDASSPHFEQRVFISHVDETAPVVLELGGYSATHGSAVELATLLSANQVKVEYRFFGVSLPDPIDWDALTLRQAADDHHRIVTLLSDIYTGAWLNSGTSKGGAAAMIHRRYYPDDVAATFAYVAPVLQDQLDSRLTDYLLEAGDEACRDRVKRFQQLVLENREAVMAEFVQWASANNHTFERWPMDLALEYGVLEYYPQYFQWNPFPCESIPEEGADAATLFNHLLLTVPLQLYVDSNHLLVSYYHQAALEIGEYAFITDHLDGLLVPDPQPVFTRLAPLADVAYQGETMADVLSWVRNEGTNIVLLYGGADLWTAAAVELNGGTNAIKVVVPGAVHSVQISDAPESDREAIYVALESWLGVTINR